MHQISILSKGPALFSIRSAKVKQELFHAQITIILQLVIPKTTPGLLSNVFNVPVITLYLLKRKTKHDLNRVGVVTELS